MDMDGSNRKQLTNSNIPKFDLQWLPDSSELLYGEYSEDNCIYKVDADASDPTPEVLGCFSEEENFNGFRVSPDGKYMAVSIKNRLLVLPFDLDLLATAKSAFELQNSESMCIDYADVTVKSAQWSADGKSLAILFQGPIGNLTRLGETVRILELDLVRCEAVDPVVLDEFPGTHFTPDGYAATPVLPSYHWDGMERFLFNTYVRNGGYGDQYLYDVSTTEDRRINPVNGTCCYRTATFSPDGTYILFAYQDRSLGFDSRTQLYYIPLEGSGAVSPFRLPLGFFTDKSENVLFALRPPGQ